MKNNTVAYRKRLQYTDEHTRYVVDIIENGLEENEKSPRNATGFHPVIMYIYLLFSYSRT